MSMRQNLSPGPGYKLKDRNSALNDSQFKNTLSKNQQLSDSDISSKITMMKNEKPLRSHGSNSLINLQSKRTTTGTSNKPNPLMQSTRLHDYKYSAANISSTIDYTNRKKLD